MQKSKISILLLLILYGATVCNSTRAKTQIEQQSSPDKNEKTSDLSDSYVDDLTGMRFILIKGGCFKMGSPQSENGRKDDEVSNYKVCLDDFWMSQYEVTNGQYRYFNKDHDSKKYFGIDLNRDTQPVVFVNWHDSVRYAAWLSRKTGKSFRLPTEAEWEYAARGGSVSAYYWGDEQTQACAYANVGDQTASQNNVRVEPQQCTDGFAASAPVGSLKPNAYGLYDMLGNVWEWTADWYDENNQGMKKNNPKGPESGQFRVLRGGSWFSSPEYVRAAKRSWYRPDSHNNSLGFRLVMTTKP